MLLAGRSSGQALVGGTGAGDDLTFQTTSNGTKGDYIFSEMTTAGFLKNSVSGVVTGGNSITDSDVPDTITASNYLPLSGGTLTGQLVADNLGIEFDESDTNPTCSAGNYSIYADLSEGKLKKCQNGTATDLDTTSSGGSGEANTASNVGSVGTGIFKQKTSEDLEFYKINSQSSGLTVALNGTDRLDLTLDDEIQAFTALVSAADKIPYYTGSGTAALADFTSAARSLLDDSDAATMRTTLGLVIGTNVLAPNGDGSGLSGVVTAETDPVVGAVNGLVKANGAGTISAASAGTDYVAATSGSEVQKGNGSGGLTAATPGTDFTDLGNTIEKTEISDATATPAASKIPIADGSGLLDGWISTATAAVKGLASFSSSYFSVSSGAVSLNTAMNFTATGAWVFTSGTLMPPNGTTAPGTCTVGMVFFDTDATAGSNWYGCTATNTWTLMGGSGGSLSYGTAFPGSPSTGDLFVVTDDSAAGACDSAAGSARSLCQYNGSSWVPVGDGGTGSDTNAIWQVSGPVVSLIPKLAPLGETDAIAPNDKDTGTYTNFSRSADETADETVGCWKGFIPADINSSGNAYFGIEWYSKTATTGAVQWYAVVRNRTQGGSWDAIGTKYAASSESTQSSVDQSTFTFWSVAVSTIGWTANYETEVCFNRDGDGTAGTDSMNGDAQAEVFKIGADRA